MSLYQLFKNISPFIKPYKWLVALTLLLTFIGSFTAQVNAWVLRYTVDQITELLNANKGLQDGLSILLFISIVLIGKEILNSFIQFV